RSRLRWFPQLPMAFPPASLPERLLPLIGSPGRRRIVKTGTSGEEANSGSGRPGVMIETEDHRTAEEAGDQDEYHHHQHDPAEPQPGAAAVGTATGFAQHQHQPRTDDGGRPKPAMAHQDPGIVGRVKTTPEPAEDAGDHRGEGAKPDAIPADVMEARL